MTFLIHIKIADIRYIIIYNSLYQSDVASVALIVEMMFKFIFLLTIIAFDKYACQRKIKVSNVGVCILV